MRSLVLTRAQRVHGSMVLIVAIATLLTALTGLPASAQSAQDLPTAPTATAIAPKQVPYDPVRNELGPLNLRWFGLLEFATPGLGGVRAGADVYLPKAPVFLAFQYARDFGSDVIHAAGKTSMDFTAGTMTVEGKVGLFQQRWQRHERRDLTVTTQLRREGDSVLSKVATYALNAPEQYTRAYYVGWRSRSVPGGQPCGPTDLQLTEDCERSSSPFLMLGVNSLTEAHFWATTKEHGARMWSWGDAWDVHVLFAADAERYGRSSLVRRLGFEVQRQQTSPDGGIVLHYGAGWDGQYVLLQFGMGYGRSHSFGQGPKSNSEIR